MYTVIYTKGFAVYGQVGENYKFYFIRVFFLMRFSHLSLDIDLPRFLTEVMNLKFFDRKRSGFYGLTHILYPNGDCFMVLQSWW